MVEQLDSIAKKLIMTETKKFIKVNIYLIIAWYIFQVHDSMSSWLVVIILDCLHVIDKK